MGSESDASDASDMEREEVREFTRWMFQATYWKIHDASWIDENSDSGFSVSADSCRVGMLVIVSRDTCPGYFNADEGPIRFSVRLACSATPVDKMSLRSDP